MVYVCVYIYVYIFVVHGGGGGGGGLTLSPMTHNSELHVVYSGFAIPCLLNACFLLAGVFVTWSSFFLTQFTLYFLF